MPRSGRKPPSQPASRASPRASSGPSSTGRHWEPRAPRARGPAPPRRTSPPRNRPRPAGWWSRSRTNRESPAKNAESPTAPRSRCRSSEAAPAPPLRRLSPGGVRPERGEVAREAADQRGGGRVGRRDRDTEPLAGGLQRDGRIRPAEPALGIQHDARSRRRRPGPAPRHRPVGHRETVRPWRRRTPPSLQVRSSTFGIRPRPVAPQLHLRASVAAAARRQPAHLVRPGRDRERADRGGVIHAIAPGRVAVREGIDPGQRSAGDHPLRERRLDPESGRRAVDAARLPGTGSQNRSPPSCPVATKTRAPLRLRPHERRAPSQPVVANPGGDRVAGPLLVRHQQIVIRPPVHRPGEPGVRLAVDQHPDHPHRRVQHHTHRVGRAQPPGGLDFAEQVGAGVAGDEGDVVANGVVATVTWSARRRGSMGEDSRPYFPSLAR